MWLRTAVILFLGRNLPLASTGKAKELHFSAVFRSRLRHRAPGNEPRAIILSHVFVPIGQVSLSTQHSLRLRQVMRTHRRQRTAY